MSVASSWRWKQRNGSGSSIDVRAVNQHMGRACNRTEAASGHHNRTARSGMLPCQQRLDSVNLHSALPCHAVCDGVRRLSVAVQACRKLDFAAGLAISLTSLPIQAVMMRPGLHDEALESRALTQTKPLQTPWLCGLRNKLQSYTC